MRIWVLSMLCLVLTCCANAQENEQVFVQGKRYISINIQSLDKYARRLERTQKSLLKKLKRKEQRLAKRLFRTDSAAYAKLKAEPLSFDSIAKLAMHQDSATLASKAFKGGQKTMDSLKGTYDFLQARAQKVTGALNSKELNTVASITGYNKELNDLQSRLSYDQYITDLTSKQANNLEGIAGTSSVTGIQKELFYAKAKIAEWKKIADEPSRLETLALEYLQGTKGFDVSLNQSLNGNNTEGMSDAASASDLEGMGFQTKRLVTAGLQQKFGNNLSGIQGNLGKEVNQWQSQAQGLATDVKATKQSLTSLKHTEKPKFSINPMRGKPFILRLRKEYSFSTVRANTTTDGKPRPAILTIAGSLAYRQTPKLSIGLGVAGDIGLGESWSSIRFSFEGLGARSFLKWEWQYGIGAYLGYERTYLRYAFQQNKETTTATIPIASQHKTNKYSDACLLGLTKSYKINSRWNGCIQVLFDAFFADKNLRSPIVLRIVNSK